MNPVLIDTSVWSEVFRRRKRIDLKIHKNFSKLIDENRVILIGPVRQELLGGLKDEQQFNRLNSHLNSFPDHTIHTEEYEIAARFNNQCRKQGVQGSHIDFLICSVATNNNFLLWTKDKDFKHFSKILPLEFYKEV